MREFARPDTVEQAMAALSAGPCHILAGGTDLYPLAGSCLSGFVLDITAIPALQGITQTADGLRIGACTRWGEIANAALPPAFHALQQAARQVGGRQIQNVATIGGNLCNASPAADGVPPLLALAAEVELVSPRGRRRLALADFLQGPRQTARQGDELLCALHVPNHALQGGSAFLKLGARAYLVISIAMVAARVVLKRDRITDVALAIGACSATAQRLLTQERALLGLCTAKAQAALDPALITAPLAPIDDIRATASYRLQAAITLTQRALAQALTAAVALDREALDPNEEPR